MAAGTSGSDYEVYLSFRGPDTRQGFADVLYEHMERAGIRAFRDDDVAIGEDINKTLQIIETSQICVPIFSRTSAKSKWCLAEVGRMVELNKDVVPIFYDVTPDDVGLRTPVYREFMSEHERADGKKKVEDWENALGAVAKLKGWEVSDTSYTKFCKMFVGELLKKLKPRKRYDLDNLVGMDNQLESATELLQIGENGVSYLVIHGMGGIGKTTLAKVLLDKLSGSFDSVGFLEDLRETTRRGGFDRVQKQLGDSLDPRSATTSNLARDIRERFRGKKVMIILDDPESGEQIERLVGYSWFASGSRIIITTRNKDVLNECSNLGEGSIWLFEMSTLKPDEALQLFSLYAFRSDTPPADYKILSDDAVSTTGRLPLALKVMGSLLRGKEESVWINVITRSRKIPSDAVKQRLKISYDLLDQDQQQIFLDIACFFSGAEKSNPCYMWEACDWYPTYGLEVLSGMSLVKVTEWNTLSMHDQLRDLGRDIVREECFSNPTRRSRIWLQQDALRVLTGKEGKQAVEALSLRTPLDNVLTDKHLDSFENVRFLELVGATFEGNSNDLLSNLRWLSWHKCPASFNFSLENLVILDLSQSSIDENWGGWSQIQIAGNLKILDLRSCHNLTRTPDFSIVPNLERLIMSDCSKLATIGSSIGCLRRLKFLDLTDCYALHDLPNELGSLEDLEEILVEGGEGTFSLPKSVGNLKSLASLTLDYLELDDIPDSIGGLVNLKRLSVRWSGIGVIPEALGGLGSLVRLDLSYSGVIQLPDSIGGLGKLEELCLHHCGPMKELPDSLWCLTSLIRLDLSGMEFITLPDSVGDLRELQELNISGSKVTTLPASIGKLTKLTELNADSCDSLVELPPDIGKLSSLKKLCLSGSSIRTLPVTIAQLSFLRELLLEGCHHLQELPELPLGLANLTVSSSCLKKARDLEKLDIISSLVLTDIHDLEAVQKLPNLKNLELVLSSANTGPFDITSLIRLERVSLSIKPVDSTLSSSVLGHQGAGVNLPRLSSLKNLLGLDIHNILREDDEVGCLGIRELQNLKVVWVDNCSSKLIDVSLASSLRSLTITECKTLKALPDLSHLKALTDFDVMGCDDLRLITGLERLESLNTLSIIHCASLERLGNLSKLKLLSELYVDSCPCLSCIDGINESFIEYLMIKNCEQWKPQ